MQKQTGHLTSAAAEQATERVILKKAALTACSNGLPRQRAEQIRKLIQILKETGIETVYSPYLYEKEESPFSGTPRERARALMEYYTDPTLDMILDVSGGDAANGILPYLDFSIIRNSKAVFWGYSDLTTIINAIYTKTGKTSVLYQIKNLTDEKAGAQQRNAFRQLITAGTDNLFHFSARFLCGKKMEGIVVGGNMRCFLKLAGTEYWPDMNGKILLLEASGGLAPQMASCLAQLNQIGVFRQIKGILLGTFLKMEESKSRPTIEELVLEYAGEKIPVAQTDQIGHKADSHGIIIGEKIKLCSDK